jgi:hypothetical protein
MNFTGISSASPSRPFVEGTKVDHDDKKEKDQGESPSQLRKEKEESDTMIMVDEQPSLLNSHSSSSISIDQHTTNILDMTDDRQNSLDETNLITIEEEHTISLIIPDQDIFMVDEQFQVAQAKVSQKESVVSSKQLLKSKTSLTTSQDENIKQQSPDSDFPSIDRPHNSPSATEVHTTVSDRKQQLTSSISHDDPQLLINRSSSLSDVDLSDQPDRLRLHEDTTSEEQSPISSASTSEEKFK